MELTLRIARPLPPARPRNGAQAAAHRRHGRGARRQQRHGVPQADRRAWPEAAASAGDEEAELGGLGRHFGHSPRQRHRRRSWRRQPRADRRCARRCGGGHVASARRVAPGRPSLAPSTSSIRCKAALKGSRLKDAARDRSLYLVGGSFRALALLDIKDARPPAADRPPALDSRPRDLPTCGRFCATGRLTRSRRCTGISSARLPTLPAARPCSTRWSELLGPKRVTVSAFGLREGMLYRDLDEATRAQDPLLAGALEVGERLGRFGDHGAALDQWMDSAVPRRSPADCSGCGWPPACSATSPGTPIPIFAPSARSTWRSTAIGSGSMRMAGRCSAGRCAARSAATADSAKSLTALLKPGELSARWPGAGRFAWPSGFSGGTEALLRKTSIALTAEASRADDPEASRRAYADAVDAAPARSWPSASAASRCSSWPSRSWPFDPVGAVELHGQPVRAEIHRHHPALGHPADDSRARRAQHVARRVPAGRLADELAQAPRCGRLRRGPRRAVGRTGRSRRR